MHVPGPYEYVLCRQKGCISFWLCLLQTIPTNWIWTGCNRPVSSCSSSMTFPVFAKSKAGSKTTLVRIDEGNGEETTWYSVLPPIVLRGMVRLVVGAMLQMEKAK